MSFKRILLLPFLLISIFVSAQTARLNGKVINSQNEVVANASIEISPLNKTIAADVEGRFSIQVTSGVKYTLTVTSAGYNAKIIDDVTATAGEDNTINIVLENKTLEEVVVRSSVRKETTSALINFQRNNASLSSGLAADFIKRTPDKNTGEILKRVSGTSVQDNKFVVVRGLGDRYNAAFLNGAQLPSSEPDRKAFSFDMIPSTVVDNIVINKTATPDLTGEFAGGLVQVTTKDVPTKDFLTLGVTLGYNTNSTFKDFTANERSSTDWLGFDDGRRSLPSAFPSSRQAYALFQRSFQKQFNVVANYNKLIADKHNVGAMIGAEYFGTRGYDMQVLGTNAPTDDIPTVNASTTFVAGNNYTSESEYRIASTFGRLTYDYDQRFLMTAVFRRDGVSSLSENNRFGFFPGMSAGWNIHNEAFFEK
ncbi:MAG: hypothetical protein EOO02_01785, partial [Chitinophagaceae bacterium]